MQGDFKIFDWLVQPQLHLISGAEKSAQVEPKVMQVLVCLARHREEVVAKKAIIKEVWGNAYVSSDVLTRSISELRKVFDDDPREPRVIQTIPREGYRLIAPVAECEPADEADSNTDPTPKRGPRRLLIAAAALFVIVAGLYIGGRVTGWNLGFTASSHIESVAVLPFKNLSGDPEQDYFADAMMETLISDLANTGSLTVVSRTSAMRYRQTTKSASEIASELKVDALVEGSVLPVGNRVRITATLIDGHSDRPLWSSNYERELDDILFIQKDVARAVTHEIRVTLNPVDEQRLFQAKRIDPQAYQAYIKGRYFWNQRTRESLHKAVRYFQDACSKAPSYALAYSGLADTYSLLAHYGFEPPDEAFPKAKAAAQEALQIDDFCAEAHASVGLASMSYDRDWTTAEREFQRAIKLNPSYATVRHWYALCLLGLGRSEEAIVQAEKAQSLDPMSAIPNVFLAQCLYLARQYDRAVKQSLYTLELHPNNVTALTLLGESYWHAGDRKQALAEFQRLKALWQDDPRMLDIEMDIIGGRDKEALSQLEQFVAEQQGKPERAAFFAEAYALLGKPDQAISWLETAFEHRDSSLIILNVDPSYDSLREDPRFIGLLNGLGLSQPKEVLAILHAGAARRAR